jgi:hypothetical protein
MSCAPTILTRYQITNWLKSTMSAYSKIIHLQANKKNKKTRYNSFAPKPLHILLHKLSEGTAYANNRMFGVLAAFYWK